MSKRVALIGAGMMGAPMADRVHHAGYDLTVCDVNEVTLSRFADQGVKITRLPSDCASADIVLLVVATAEQARSVVSGEGGILSALPKGHSPIIVAMGTLSREAVVELDAAVKARGARLLDAPISGGPLRAEDGTLAIMVGGESEDLELARPVFEAMGNKIFHCGPVGSGQAVKIVNNMIGNVEVIMVGEAFRIALESGLTLEAIAPVLEASSGRCNLSQDAAEAYASYKRWSDGMGNFEGVKRVMTKDHRLALDMAAKTSGTYPLCSALLAVIDELGDETYQNWQTVGRGPQTNAS